MSTIHVHSHRLTDNFTIIPNSIINDTRLSVSERMYLIWALSLPPNWQLNTKSIATILSLGERTVNRYNKKLKEYGYLCIEKMNTGKTTWHFFQTKSEHDEYYRNKGIQPERQNGVEQKSLNANLAESQNGTVLVSTDLINKNLDICSSKNEHENEQPAFEENLASDNAFDETWKQHPRKTNKQRSLTVFKKLCKGKSDSWVSDFKDMLLKDFSARVKSGQWSNKQFIPQFDKYLRNKLWEDEIVQVTEYERREVINHQDTSWADNMVLK